MILGQVVNVKIDQGPGVLGWITAIGTLLAALVGAWAAWQAKRAADASLAMSKLEHERRDEERLRDRQAVIEGSRDPSGNYFVLTNTGRAAAVDLNLDPSVTPPRWLLARGLPVPVTLPPGGQLECPTAVTMGSHGVGQLRLTWRDGTGDRQVTLDVWP